MPLTIEEYDALSPEAQDVLEKKYGIGRNQVSQRAQNLRLAPSVQPSIEPQKGEETDIPLWQKALSTVTAPFRFIEEKITQPFGAIVTSPFTPAVAGTEGKNWFERELAEYKGWEEEPKFRIPGTEWDIGVKGAVETIPWLLTPSAMGVTGKLGALAAKGGALGRGAALAAKVTGPIAAAEQAPFKLIGKAAKGVAGKRIGETGEHFYHGSPQSGLTEIRASSRGDWGEGVYFTIDRSLAEQYSIGRQSLRQFVVGDIKELPPKGTVYEVGVALKNPLRIKTREQAGQLYDSLPGLGDDRELAKWAKSQGYDGIINNVTKEGVAFGIQQAPVLPVGKALGVVVQPRGTITQAIPDGFTGIEEATVNKVTGLFKEAKPIRRELESAYTKERAKRISAYQTELTRLGEKGVAPREALTMAERKLGGPMPAARITGGFESVSKRLTEEDGQTLFGIIRRAAYPTEYDRINTRQALARLLDPKVLGIPRDFELELLEKTFGPNLVESLLKKKPLGERAWIEFVDLLNAPRALLASLDISGLLRQGGVLFARHPIEGIKTVRPMLQAMLSDKNAALYDSVVRTRVGMNELLNPSLKTTLDLTVVPVKGAAALTHYEEAFASKTMNKIGFVRGSNRAYVQVLNDMRSRSALNVLNAWKKAGIKYTNEDVSDLNQLVNWASGRGTLPKAIQQHGRALNGIFFAPKLQFGRIQAITALSPAVTKSDLVRKEAWRTLLSFLGAGSGILAMAHLSGTGTVELDPRSPDFGKLKVEDTRLDIWSGYSQLMRFAAQVTTGQRKTEAGRVYSVPKGEVALRYLQSKMSPAAGLIRDIFAGETFLGEEVFPKEATGFWKQVYERTAPLAVQDVIDGIRQDGPLGGLVSGWGFFGVGVATYVDDVRNARENASLEKTGMSWDELGKTQGRAAQLRLEQTTPAITKEVKEQEKRFATGNPSTMQQYREEMKTAEDTYRETVKLASEEYKATNNGRAFRERVDQAAATRREMYSVIAKKDRFAEIVDYYSQPLTTDQISKMNPGDVLRREYTQSLFAPDMYDQFGKYKFDDAKKREQDFLTKYGQQALDYIEEYQGAKWIDKPIELKRLEQARDTLRPYWEIADKIWSMYPPELKVIADQVTILEDQNDPKYRLVLRKYPQILRARELITTYRKLLRVRNPAIQQAYNLFY